MALTYSQDIALNAEAPAFDLPAANPWVEDRTRWSLSDFADAGVLAVVFTCNHCPYAKHVEGTLIRLARKNRSRGVRFAAISSNDSEPAKYADDSFENMAKRARERDYPFPYLHDETQETARAYGAVCTPDVYVFSRDGVRFRLKYHGRVDETRPGQGASTGTDLQRAIDDILDHGEVTFQTYPSMGCNIKWKPDETFTS